MQAPERIDPGTLADYLEVMSKSVLQTGLSWRVVEAKWPDIRQAFRGFEPAVVANHRAFGRGQLAQEHRTSCLESRYDCRVGL